jgi:uncharacterized membrane protein
MVKAPLIIAGLMIVALTMPIQTSFGSTRILDLTLYSDGSAHVSSQLEIDPLDPDYEVSLFGSSIDNFVVVGENGFLLSSEIIDDKAMIDTFGSSSISIDYDIHDLISKEGRVWTFTLDSPTDYSLLMPPNSIIVGMDALPSNMDLINDQTKLDLSSGLFEINYIFGSTQPPITQPPITQPPITQPPITTPEQPNNDISTIALVGVPVAAAIAGVAIVIKRKQTKSSSVIQTESVSESQIKTDMTDTENIFNLRPDMREDDKEIIKFISANGGEALESDLRKKFLQPRTTMWRAVKRLERQGVIEIFKKDLQNLVKLKKDLEEEE